MDRVEENQQILKGCEDGVSRKPSWPQYWKRQGKVMVTRIRVNGSIYRKRLSNRSFSAFDGETQDVSDNLPG